MTDYTASIPFDVGKTITPEEFVAWMVERRKKLYADIVEMAQLWEDQWEFGEYVLDGYGGWFV